MVLALLVHALALLALVRASVPEEACEARARTAAGWVCGSRRSDVDGGLYGSFLNVPYARQPVGELRFKELQPPDSWNDLYDATKVGPICPQYDIIYGPLMTNKIMSEACIHANIYVPLHALPIPTNITEVEETSAGLPIFVFVHGGGFAVGSGDPDLYGPEYLLTKDMIIMTFNYRINVFGFLSLNTRSIPGNNGLRDTVTFLRWVRENAKFFGGNPNDVTIGGHSAGGANAHLMVLSKAAKGLFKRAILLSGVGVHNFYTASPEHANEIANALTSRLGIDCNDPEEVARQLIKTPLDKLLNATAEVQIAYNPISFSPVVEQYYPGITTVIDKDPKTLLLEGQGQDIPLLIGFTNLEGQFFAENYRKYDILASIEKDPLLMLAPDLVYRVPRYTALGDAYKSENRCFMGEPTVEKYAKCYSDYAFIYPAIKLAQYANGRVPAFLYQFSYNPDFSAIKETKNFEYKGAAHVDDLTFIFRTNSMQGKLGFDYPTIKDVEMREHMVQLVKNFMSCSDPECSNNKMNSRPNSVKYLDISTPNSFNYSGLTPEQKDMVQYYDALYREATENQYKK